MPVGRRGKDDRKQKKLAPLPSRPLRENDGDLETTGRRTKQNVKIAKNSTRTVRKGKVIRNKGPRVF